MKLGTFHVGKATVSFSQIVRDKINQVFGTSVSKESACSAGDPGLITNLGRSPREGNGKPLQYPCLEKSHGQRSLVGCSPWDHKESGMIV